MADSPSSSPMDETAPLSQAVPPEMSLSPSQAPHSPLPPPSSASSTSSPIPPASPSALMTLSQKRALKIRRNNDYLQKMGLGRGIIAGIDEGDEENSDKEEVEKEEKVDEGKKRRILTEEEVRKGDQHEVAL